MMDPDDEALAPFRLIHRGREAQQAALRMVSSEIPLRQPKGDRVLLAGDWHGNTVVAQRALELAVQLGVDTILQLGDFGCWTGDGGEGYLDALSTVAVGLDLMLLFVDGNHEAFPVLLRYPLTPVGLRVVRPHVYHLPRGHRWHWRTPEGTAEWLSVGGAASVDAGLRTPGWDWWPQEQLTEVEAAVISAAGHADVLVCHDRPTAAAMALHDVPGEWHDRGRRQGWLTEHLVASDQHAARLQRLVDAVTPTYVHHGHLHARTNVLLGGPWGQYRVQGLDSDDRPGANTLLVTTSGAAV